MSTLPNKAQVVVIGAGIVGNSLVYHLAQKGWNDIVLLDKGPLPNPGGSTGHASNFLFLVDHSKEMALLTLDSTAQFKELGVFTESGGIEVARTEARMEEFRRRMASAKAWGIPSKLVSVDEILELVPYINPEVILGGFYTPGVGVVDSLRAGTLMREKAEAMGALKIFGNTKVEDIKVKNGRVRGVKTSRGDLQADYVVIACGVWSPKLARMAGANIPLACMVHQMISVGPVPLFEKSVGEIEYPIVRDMDTNMYERQSGNEMEVGSYAHRPIIHEMEEIPSIEEAAMSPTEMPFTEDDFELQMEHALELMPAILDDERVGVHYAINGLLSLTPDGYPLLGETPEVENLWSAAAVWIKEGPGVGRMLAEWMTDGASEIDPHHSNIARFYDYAKSKTHIYGRVSEGFNKTYGIVHPAEQWESSRNNRLSPFYPREKDLGAVFYDTAGWERPHWYGSNKPLLEKYQDQIQDRPHEWDARWWSPIISAEHLAMREAVGMVDLTAFAIFDFAGPGALDYMQKMAVAQMDVPVGRAVYTPLLANNGGFKADLTIMRLAPDRFRVVTGGGDGSTDKKWFTDHLPENHSVQLHDMTSALCTVGLWGPKARKVLESVSEDDVSHEGFPFATAGHIYIDQVKAWALRISYVGELGWEIYAPMEHGLRLWDILWEAGQPHGIVPMGIGVYGTTARLEKGYRLYGHELELEYTVFEAGLNRPKTKNQDFIGRETYLRHREEESAAILCTLTVDDHASASGVERFMLGGEPILTVAGEPLVDRKGRRSFVTSAGSGPSVGKHILMAYLPPEYAVQGNNLKVEYMTEQYPVTVAVVGNRPLFDPQDERMKC